MHRESAVRGAKVVRAEGVVETTPAARAVRGAKEKRAEGVVGTTPAARAIEVVKASTHNLKAIDCSIPHGKVTVVTGPSGSGKSSLAFDTVYAEAQRRFIESMSTYARQFLEQVERPPVEAMRGILPAVALAARNTVKNARSTVGTMTEAYDVLRLVFAHLGRVACEHGHGELRSSTAPQAADQLVSAAGGEPITVLAPIRRPAKRADAALAELVRQGYFRILHDGRVERIEARRRWPKELDPLPLVLGRFSPSPRSRSRLTAAIEEAYRLSGGRVELRGAPDRFLGQRLTCPECGATSTRPQPALFSFNSPLGACPECQGFGRVIGVDRERVIPDPGKTLRERPIAPWNSPSYEEHYQPLWKAARRRGVPLDVPWRDLDASAREWVWSGDADRDFVSLSRFFAWLERRNYKMHVRVLLSRYRAYEECRSCGGRRLCPEALSVKVKGKDASELARLSVEELRAWLQAQTWEPWERETAAHLLDELGGRLDTLHRVGLDYLTLDRQARTLAGGEAQRIQLASALGTGLTSTLYVLDEPTIGLHPQDSERLLALLRDLASRGNTVLVVEHDRTLIRGADHVIDLGPRAGDRGGEVMAEGSFEEVLRSETSLTARYLRNGIWGDGERAGAGGAGGDCAASEVAEARAGCEPRGGFETAAIDVDALPRIGIRGAAENNLRDLDVDLPVGCLVAVTGVSGSGKSTLVHRVLHDTYQRSKGVVEVEPGRCRELLGLERLEDLVLVDQRPLGRSSRSNPVTYSKAYDEIRRLFASTPSARREGVTAGHFSFNLEGGRCPDCEGTGVEEVDMQFMAPVEVVCDRCQGRRFLPKVLAVTWGGLDIAETLELTVEQAQAHFAAESRVRRRLESLAAVGLGYLRLGQSTATLSGGEAQRLKLATFLDAGRGARRAAAPRLFLFDEPTTGLHMADIDLLHRTLRRLVARGDGVVVIEHSLDLIARADWIVDLGPGGGEHGGALLFSGPRQRFVEEGRSPTAVELRLFLAGA
ncbi:MAG TPA: excinuclease ABC subunit UvrA [Thermoanaerobaculia bacterium]|nr:excinuclease ABC subunit UvrA [Thermoanaerobaculia bacterium]